MSIRPHLIISAVGLLASCLAAGCCCPRDYVQPACPPVATYPSTIRQGSVCEAEDGTVVTRAPSSSRPSTIAGSPRPRVVVSEPGGNRIAARSSGWRRADPEGIATTRVEGALDDSVNR